MILSIIAVGVKSFLESHQHHHSDNEGKTNKMQLQVCGSRFMAAGLQQQLKNPEMNL